MAWLSCFHLCMSSAQRIFLSRHSSDRKSGDKTGLFISVVIVICVCVRCLELWYGFICVIWLVMTMIKTLFGGGIGSREIRHCISPVSPLSWSWLKHWVFWIGSQEVRHCISPVSSLSWSWLKHCFVFIGSQEVRHCIWSVSCLSV